VLTVITYFWHPDPGSKFAAPYTADDVRRLRRQVKRHLTTRHEFAVVTDRPHMFDGDVGIRAIPLDKAKHVPGTCYARLMTFHPDGADIFGERVMQVDLDTLIVGNMDKLVDRDEDLILWRNPARIPWDGPAEFGVVSMARAVRRCYYNTSFLMHRCGSMPDVWSEFNPNRLIAKDDQWYLSNLFGRDCAYVDASHGVYRLAREDTPGSGVDGKLPENACVVTFPGSNGKWSDPRIRQANPWIEEHLAA
jgi:hypothetical protein